MKVSTYVIMVESHDLKAKSAQEKATDTSEASDFQQKSDEPNSLDLLESCDIIIA